MPKKQETVEIDGVKYRITQLGALTGKQLMFRLGRTFAAVALGLRSGTLDVGVISSLDPADFDWIVQTLIPTTDVGIHDVEGDGKLKWHKLSVDFDDHFAGRYPQLIEWLQAGLEVNFGPLRDALGSIFRGAAALSASSPPKASTGSAGDSSSARD
jgi:hypothetical protein